MNKYTLRFQDVNLEKSYQIKKRESYQFIFFLILSIATNVVLILNIIQNYKDQNNLIMNNFKIGASIYIFLQAIYIFNKRQYTDAALFTINLIAFVPGITLRTDHNIYDAHLLGQNQMLSQTIILIISSLPSAISANITLCAARLILISYRSENPYLTQYVYSIIITILMCAVSYVIEKLERSIFLLTIKDNSLEKILPHLVNKAFCIFTFDKESMRFRNLMINIIQAVGTEEPLRYFLSQTKYKNQSLREYLYSKIKSLDLSKPEVHKELLKVLIDKKIETIAVSVFYMNTVTFTITIEQDSQNAVNCNQMTIKTMKSMTRGMIIHLMSTFKQKYKNIKLILSYLQAYYYINTKSELHLDKFDFNKAIGKLIRMIKITQKSKIKFIKTSPVIIQTFKEPMMYFLIEILKNSDFSKFILVKTKLDSQGQLTLFIQGLLLFANNKVYQKFQKMLVEDITFENGSANIKFYKDPQLSYYQNEQDY